MATGELPINPERQPQDGRELNILWAQAHHRGRVRAAKFPLFPVVQRCLEKNPTKRFQSFDEVLAAVARIAGAYKLHLPREQVSDSEFDDAYTLAMSLTALGKPDDAITKLTEITQKWPQVPQPFNEMGKILLTQGKTSEAIPWFKRALEIDESRTSAWNNLGGAHARLGELEPAEFAYSCAIQADSENTDAMIGLAQVLMQRNPALALKWCERAWDELLTAFLELESAIRGSHSFPHLFTGKKHSSLGEKKFQKPLVINSASCACAFFSASLVIPPL